MYSYQKILLLDDNRDLLKILQIILKGQGYETVLASSIQEATLKIKIHKPVLVLMDICLSGENGYSFCGHLKNDRETQDMRIILMSGEDCNQSMIQIAHADDFMQKPFDYNDLMAKVEKHYEYAVSAEA